MTAPTTAGGAALPVAGYRLNSGHGNHFTEALNEAQQAFLWAGKPAWRELTYLDTAQAEIDALRAENEQWKSTLWAVARELNCLPSTFSDGNAHVLKAAIKLSVELAELKAAQDDHARDVRRLDWLDEKAQDSCVEVGFEMDGGVYLRLDTPGDPSLDIREKNSAREAIDAAIAAKG